MVKILKITCIWSNISEADLSFILVLTRIQNPNVNKQGIPAARGSRSKGAKLGNCWRKKAEEFIP